MPRIDVFKRWQTDKFFDCDTREELMTLDPIRDAKEIEDRFYKDIEFGTGGMRGIMGAGTNRLNKYTVGRATAGLGKHLLALYGEDACSRGVAVGYDTRKNSEYFARVTADVLSALGIRVFLHAYASPTPQLAFSVRLWGCVAGVVITASHNTKEYNGYKVYDENGCQLVPSQVKGIIDSIHEVGDFRNVDYQGDWNRITMADAMDEYVDAVRSQARLHDEASKENLSIVFTPLHGTGNVPVMRTLKREGFTHLQVVGAQTNTDGEFSTVVSPNPEERDALSMGIQQAQKTGADIVLGADPDCDRVGVAIKVGDDYRLLTGNEVGALLTDYVICHTNTSAMRPVVLKTVVSGELGAAIARANGIDVLETLTGFKYIGERISQFEQAKRIGDELRQYDFLFGYEESYGYLAGGYVQDKDGAVATLLVCEMAAVAKAEGKTLYDKLHELHQTYGCYVDKQDSLVLPGKDGQERMIALMDSLRSGTSPFEGTAKTIDYLNDVESGAFGLLPKSNVLKFVLTDGSWVAIRPSGTEPKLKVYYSIRGVDEDEARSRLESLRATITRYL